MRTAIKSLRGTEIFVDHDGLFSAEVNGTTVFNHLLSEVEKAIPLTKKGAPALLIWSGDYQIWPVSIIGYSALDYSSWITNDGNVLSGYVVYAPDPAIEARMVALRARYQELESERDALVASLRPFSVNDLAGKNHDQSSKGAPDGEDSL